jgi:hypothetical protein
VCCGAFDSDKVSYRSTQCTPTCSVSPVAGLLPVRFCDPNAAVDECAEVQKSCQSSATLDGYFICR